MSAYDEDTFGDDKDTKENDDDEEEMVSQTDGTSNRVRHKSPDEWENPQASTDDRRAPPLP